MPKFYVYKMTADNGGAPCVRNGLLSLAICKPVIRRIAKVNDVIFGFGAMHYGERLIYIAVITDKLPPGIYYRATRYRSRPDCIYQWRRGSARWVRGKLYHEDGAQLASDVGHHFEKAHVLLSRDFRYFGGAHLTSHAEYPHLREFISTITRGHRVNFPSAVAQELRNLKTSVWRRWRKKSLGSPTDADFSKPCNE